MAQKAFSVSLADTVGMQEVMRVLGGGPTVTGRIVTPESAMRVAAVWGCVRVLAETVGSLPFAVYERDAGGNSKKIEHAVYDVLGGSPNADMTPQEVIETIMVNLALTGNAYTMIDRGPTGRLVAVTPVSSDRVVPKRTPSGAIVYTIMGLDGKTQDYPAELVWHIKGFGSNGLVGFSPVGMARQSIGVSMDTEEFGARFFRDGASAAGVITADNWLTDKQRVIAREVIDKNWSGLREAHKVQLLEGGLKYQSVTMPLEDAQFLETRRFQVSEICRIYRVPPHMIADLERATFTNIEQQALEFVQYAILPYLVRFEQTISKKLFSPIDMGRRYVRFNPEGLLRGDSAARAALYSTFLQNGVASRNEVRAKENWSRIDEPGMDDYTVQQNMAMVSDISRLVGGDRG